MLRPPGTVAEACARAAYWTAVAGRMLRRGDFVEWAEHYLLLGRAAEEKAQGWWPPTPTLAEVQSPYKRTGEMLQGFAHVDPRLRPILAILGGDVTTAMTARADQTIRMAEVVNSVKEDAISTLLLVPQDTAAARERSRRRQRAGAGRFDPLRLLPYVVVSGVVLAGLAYASTRGAVRELVAERRRRRKGLE